MITNLITFITKVPILCCYKYSWEMLYLAKQS